MFNRIRAALVAFALAFIAAPALAQSTVSASGTITTGAPSVGVVIGPGLSSCGVLVAGAFSGTLVFEATLDPQTTSSSYLNPGVPSITSAPIGTHWLPISASPDSGGAAVSSTTAAGAWIIPAAGHTAFRVRETSLASGTPFAEINCTAASAAPSTAAVNASLPVDQSGFMLAPNSSALFTVGGGTRTVRTGAGRFFGVNITTAGTAAISCYDNTAASGTALVTTPATTTVGTLYPLNLPPGGIPIATGVTCTAPASSPAFTVLWSQ